VFSAATLPLDFVMKCASRAALLAWFLGRFSYSWLVTCLAPSTMISHMRFGRFSGISGFVALRPGPKQQLAESGAKDD